jgi:AraC-like DNA-binding protein
VGPEDEAVFIVRGGPATITLDQGSPVLVTPVHAFRLERSGRVTIRRHSADTRCTALIYSGDDGPGAEHARRDSSRAVADPRRFLFPLGATALLQFFWLRHRLSGGVSLECEDVAASARTLRREALASGASFHATLLRSPVRRARRAVVERVQTRLSASIHHPHRLVEIAAALGISPFHLARTFREETGISLHQFLVRLRLIEALDRLSAGAPDLSAIAFGVGFSSHSHFSLAFRRGLGLSPSEARRVVTRSSNPDAVSSSVRAACVGVL